MKPWHTQMVLPPLQVGQLQGVARSGAEAHVKLSRLFQQIMSRGIKFV